jgi:hypothetical protein
MILPLSPSLSWLSTQNTIQYYPHVLQCDYITQATPAVDHASKCLVSQLNLSTFPLLRVKPLISIFTWQFLLMKRYQQLWPHLWPIGHSSWLQIQRSGFDSRRYQIYWLVGLERGPLSLVSTIEEPLGRKSSGSGIEIREYGRKDPRHPLSAKVGTNFADKRRSLAG